MANRTFDKEAAAQRLEAYIEMLKTVYDIDEYGLADMIGIHRGTWTKFRRAAWGDKSANIVLSLSMLTGISMSWLYAEKIEAED